jgi:hypothetical protein
MFFVAIFFGIVIVDAWQEGLWPLSVIFAIQGASCVVGSYQAGQMN